MDEIEFNEIELADLTDQIRGETIMQIFMQSEGQDDFLIIQLDDGRKIKFSYDWIYDYRIVEP